MATAAEIEALYGCTPPAKTICHVYAVSGNSVSVGSAQFIGGASGMPAAMKAKYWDVTHTNVWRLNNNYMAGTTANKWDMIPIQKIYEPLYVLPELDNTRHSSPMIIFPRLKELYSNSIHIGICHVSHNGVGHRLTTDQNYNVAMADPIAASKNMVKNLARSLDLTIRHLTAMGYDVRFKGFVCLGESVMDVQDVYNSLYTTADYKTDFTDRVNYFRTTLGYTDAPFYVTETTMAGAYPTEEAAWNVAMSELNTSLGGIYVHRGQHWWVLADGVHPNGATGYLGWGEGAAVGADKNMAELIYSIENP